MPHKHNADRRHHILKMSFKVQNWSAYEAGLRRRGSRDELIEMVLRRIRRTQAAAVKRHQELVLPHSRCRGAR